MILVWDGADSLNLITSLTSRKRQWGDVQASLCQTNSSAAQRNKLFDSSAGEKYRFVAFILMSQRGFCHVVKKLQPQIILIKKDLRVTCADTRLSSDMKWTHTFFEIWLLNSRKIDFKNTHTYVTSPRCNNRAHQKSHRVLAQEQLTQRSQVNLTNQILNIIFF